MWNRKLSRFIRSFFKKIKKQNKNMHITLLHWFTIKKKKRKRKRTDIQKGSKREQEREARERWGNGCSNTDSKLKWKTVSP